MGEELMIAGIGCRAGVSGEQVEAAISAALAALQRATFGEASKGHLSAVCTGEAAPPHAGGSPCTFAGPARLTAIATPAMKAHEPGIRAAAAARGVPLLAISQRELEAANSATLTRSEYSIAAMNVQSVAEAAALAGALAAGGSGVSASTTAVFDRTPRLLQPRVVLGPVTCALATTTQP